MKSERTAASKVAERDPTVSKRPASAKADDGSGKRSASKKSSLQIPPILFESQPAAATESSGPGQRYVLGLRVPAEQAAETEEKVQLPESYGTKRFSITPRDPYWIYASWDFSLEHQRKLNANSVHGHLILRVYLDSLTGEPIGEVHLHPESRHWFIHVGRGGTKYVVELGYRNRKGRWQRVAMAGPITTPSDHVSEDESLQLATVPMEVNFEQLLRLTRGFGTEGEPLLKAVQRLNGYDGLPILFEPQPRAWETMRATTLAELSGIDRVQLGWLSSLELAELARQHVLGETAAAEFSAGAAPGPFEIAESISSFREAAGRQRAFWFNLNAEVVVYGATDPNAKLTVDGQEVKLRPDGTFSYRFTLPDGQYGLSIQAIAHDGHERRSAHLQFGRTTQYLGEVGVHPQDASLPKAPLV